jgi:hypothetical protein
VTIAFVAPRLRRTLSAVYRFYDAFYFPIDDHSPPIRSPLELSIPLLGWVALRNDVDVTYRFSALTLSRPAPSGAAMVANVVATNGDYISFEPILLTLPKPVSAPPQRSDFLVSLPLWPTTALRPPDGETAVRGIIRSPTSQPVANLKVQAWTGGALIPPPGNPFTRSNAQGEFLVRFPLLKGAPGQTESMAIQLADGAVAVSPTPVSITLGHTQIVQFQRT